MRYSILISLSLILVLTLGFSNTVYSQSLNTGSDIDIELVPAIPRAGDTVYVFLNSYATDINSATMKWRVDGKNIKKGVGEKVFNFKMNDVGETVLEITITTAEGGVIDKTIRLRPVSVDLLWQTDGVVTPFYKGKSLFVHQNNVTVIAEPHIPGSNGAELNPKNLIYKWKKGGSVVESASGYGKNTYTFESSLISRPVDINVEVTSPNDDGIGYANMRLTPTDPSVVFYEKNPEVGIQFQKALIGSVKLEKSKEMAIVGIPFFFKSSDVLSGKTLFRWKINGNSANAPTSQTTQIFRQPEGVSGTSNISLSIENPDRILQFSTTNFNLVFNNKN